jgi:hypothetical protein
MLICGSCCAELRQRDTRPAHRDYFLASSTVSRIFFAGALLEGIVNFVASGFLAKKCQA